MAFLLLVSTTAKGQDTPDASGGIHATGSNFLRVGSGSTDQGNSVVDKHYLEEIANARIFFENLSLGLRYEMDDPSEVGRSFQGLRRRWIAYKKDKLALQAGDVNALFGRGLAINLFESRPLNYDTWLDGIYGKYEYIVPKEWSELRPSLSVQGVGGKLNYHSILDTAAASLPLVVSAKAINGEIGLYNKKLTIGTSFVQAFLTSSDNIFNTIVNTSREVDQPEVYLNFFAGEFDGFIGYTQMRTYLHQVAGNDSSSASTGGAVYGTASYANKDFGLVLEYKNYRYNIPTASSGQLGDPNFSKLPISSPPEVYKDFVYTTITRTTHPVNFNDELGMLAELTITAIPQVTITLYGAGSSAHESFGYDSSKNTIVTGTTSILPKFGDLAFLPFWEFSGEIEYDWSELNYIKFMTHRRSDVITYVIDGNTHTRSATTLAAKFQYKTAPSQSLLVILEHQWIIEPPADLHQYLNDELTIEYSFDPLITFGGIYDFSNRYTESRHIWPEGFVSLRIGESHNLLISYGAERKGLNCTGGICRVVPAFNGLRLTLTSQI